MCTDCGGTVIEYDAAAGNGFCVQCGTVVEENTIVNEVRLPRRGDVRASEVSWGGSGHLRRDQHGSCNGAGKFCGSRSK